MTGERILIVDDEPKICQFLEILLQREGFKTAAVHNATDALQNVETQQYDLVLTDLKMPGMDGFELVTRLKTLHKNIPIIMITGYATVETAVQALRYGVEDYVTKPFNIEELRKVIARALQSARMEKENQELMARLREASAELDRRRAQNSELAVSEATPTPAPEVTALDSRDEILQALTDLVKTERSLPRLLKRFARRAVSQVRAKAAWILMFDPNSDELLVAARAGEKRCGDLGGRVPLSETPASAAVREQRALLLKEVSCAKLIGYPENTEGGPNGSSCLIVPLVNYGRTLGVVVACEREEGLFENSDLELLAVMAAHIAGAIENATLRAALDQRSLAFVGNLISALEEKKILGKGHSKRVRDYATALARAAGIPREEIEILERTASIYDIGKLSISEKILNKPGELSKEELEEVRNHPVAGEMLLKPIEFLKESRPLIRYHHERMDGQGYPEGLSGDRIPRLARILAIADAYDAMTSERAYRPPKSAEEAAAELRAASGTQFDPELTALFFDKVISSKGG